MLKEKKGLSPDRGKKKIRMVKETMKNGSNMLGQAEKVQNMDPAQVSSTLVVPIYTLVHRSSAGRQKEKVHNTFLNFCESLLFLPDL